MFLRHAKAKGLTKEHLSTAMDRLLESGRIKVEEKGPPSKLRKRLVATGADGGPEGENDASEGTD